MASYHKYARFEITKHPHLKRKSNRDEMDYYSNELDESLNLNGLNDVIPIHSKRSHIPCYNGPMEANLSNFSLLSTCSRIEEQNTPIYSRFNDSYYHDVEHHMF